MEESGIRMKAYALHFNEIHVYLSKQYYNGYSPAFYLKNKNKIQEIKGQIIAGTQSFQEFVFYVNFTVGKEYQILDAYGLTCTLDFSRLSLCDEFDDKFEYTKDDLGNHYTKEETLFRLWAPLSTDVILKIKIKGNDYFYPMNRKEKGVYECVVKEDCELGEYVYSIKHGDTYRDTLDPYAYSSSANGKRSIVVDLNKISHHHYDLPSLSSATDAIIYETHVRDFSIFPQSGMKNKGKYLAFCEENTKTKEGEKSGLDYLVDLGITHLQLMPIHDCATMEETEPFLLYNWGYDCAQYNVGEGSYTTNPHDGYKRITEIKKMIDALHKKGIRVVLDVVYNHMYDVNVNALEGTVPHYFFRRNSDGTLSNGSWCGNDLNTKAKMCRRYIVNMCKRWQEFYGVDGYRFDLMGIIDIDTMNEIVKVTKEKDPSFLVYGEGWNMPTALAENEKTMIDNHALVPQIGFFNDFFRNTMRGSNEMTNQGYCFGEMYKIGDAALNMANLNKFTHISQSINYVECHDNATCFDKMQVANHYESLEVQKKRLRLLLGVVLLAQGVPFIHSGQEFFRTKKGIENTYNAKDDINALDWDRKDLELETIDFVKLLIKLRKDNPCFRYSDENMIKENIHVDELNQRVIRYQLHQKDKDFMIYINASSHPLEVMVEEGYRVLYHSERENIEQGHIMISSVSLVILERLL